jgi:predicted PurR-regulated permease PerM
MTLYQLGRDGNLIDRLQEFVQNNTLLQQTQAFFAGFGLHFEPTDLSAGLRDLVKYAGLFLYNKASLWAANLMTLAFKFCLMLMVIFYLLLDMERLFDFVQRISPLPQEQGTLLVRKFNEIGGAILIGNGASGLIQGTLGGLLFVLLELKSPMIWGGVMCLTAFLPILGIGLVLIPTALVLMAMGQAGEGLLVLILYLAITFTIDYGLKPKLVGRHLHIHTLLVFLSIIGAMGMFGVLGIIFGPLVITLFLTLAEIYQDSYRPGNGSRIDHDEN